MSRAQGRAGTGAIIELEHVTKRYRMGDTEVRALDDVCLSVEKGEFVAIIGPSGSGKSTLMNVLGCLDAPDAGTYFLDGADIAHSADRQLADIRNRKIGFVFQHFNLLARLTAAENVEVPLLYRGMSARKSRTLACEYLERVGLAGRERHTPAELSGGQQQRVAIARALVCGPQIILADEPTGALDRRTGRELMDLLKELNRQGQTVLLITHDVGLAAEADRRVGMEDGHLSEEGGDGA